MNQDFAFYFMNISNTNRVLGIRQMFILRVADVMPRIKNEVMSECPYFTSDYMENSLCKNACQFKDQ